MSFHRSDRSQSQADRVAMPLWRRHWRKGLLGLTVSAAALAGLGLGLGALAQDDQTAGLPSAPVPYQSVQGTAPATAQPYQSSYLSSSDQETLGSALQAVKSRNYAAADSYKQSLSDPVARKIVTWAILNADGGDIYGFAGLDAARRDLWGWPRETKRQISAEKLIGMSGMAPQQVVDWFNGSPPQTVEGATALIAAYQSLNQIDAASQLAKTWWRTKVFDSIAQANFYSAFSRYLTPDDSVARLNCLMINVQDGSSQGIRDLTAYVDDHHRDIANAVLAMRSNSASGDALYTQAVAGDPRNPALAFARARYLSGKGLEPLGFPLLADLPPASLSPEAVSQLYTLRLAYFRAALKAHDYHAAYNAMNNGGFENGESKAEAEFFAGWIALIKLKDNGAAIQHFRALSSAGTSPITQGRANYWLGRAYEARNDTAQNDAQTAHDYYVKGSQYIYAFYGQMAAEKAGVTTITLGHDPVPSDADRVRFDNRDLVKAARILGSMNEIDLFRAIVLNLDTVLPNAEEEALLVDLTQRYDSQVIAMKVARMSMQRGFYLPERAYPMRAVPDVPAPEKAFVLAITRQESGFDPTVRSRANARGMMQLIPSTARAVARRLGASYSESRLFEPDFNMSLGAYHLGELVTRFDGSYIMAAAGYNAGPSRMGLWVGDCGDPRGPNADPLSFIECMPLRETRDYMMRVTENMRIYRARLNGGTAPLTAMADVQRGLPAPIGTNTDLEDAGDGSADLPDTAINYLEYQKAEAQNAALANSLSQAAVKEPARPKATAHGKAGKTTKAAKGKKGTRSKSSSSKGHAATKGKKRKH